MSPEVLVASRPDASGRATSAPPPARQHRLVMPIVRDGRGAVKPGPTGHRPRRQGLDGASPAAARSTIRSINYCRPARQPVALFATFLSVRNLDFSTGEKQIFVGARSDAGSAQSVVNPQIRLDINRVILL